MSAEYKFDYEKAKPNRFASRMQEAPMVVVLDPDVAKIFTSGDIIVLDPLEETSFKALKETVTLVVKVPCVPNDKYIV